MTRTYRFSLCPKLASHRANLLLQQPAAAKPSLETATSAKTTQFSLQDKHKTANRVYCFCSSDESKNSRRTTRPHSISVYMFPSRLISRLLGPANTTVRASLDAFIARLDTLPSGQAGRQAGDRYIFQNNFRRTNLGEKKILLDAVSHHPADVGVVAPHRHLRQRQPSTGGGGGGKRSGGKGTGLSHLSMRPSAPARDEHSYQGLNMKMNRPGHRQKDDTSIPYSRQAVAEDKSWKLLPNAWGCLP